MPVKNKIKCAQCGVTDLFEDAIDIRQAKWKVLAWDVDSGQPICYCNKCNWEPIGKKSS